MSEKNEEQKIEKQKIKSQEVTDTAKKETVETETDKETVQVEKEEEVPVFEKQLPASEKEYYENIIAANKKAIKSLREQNIALQTELDSLKTE
jgi:hypothetical protein